MMKRTTAGRLQGRRKEVKETSPQGLLRAVHASLAVTVYRAEKRNYGIQVYNTEF